MSWEDQGQSEQALDPWRVVLGCLFELDSYQIPAVIDLSGLVVEWSLTVRENFSHKYRKDAFRPRINAAYDTLSRDDKLRVAYIVAEQLVQKDLGDKLNVALKKISWRLDEGGKLAPASEEVRELFFPPDSQYDAYVQIKEILSRARHSLRLIDPYLNETIFSILGDIEVTLAVEMLVGKPRSDFVLAATKFKMQHQSAQIKIRKSKEFHDRFIIVDEKECWHIGCSIKDAGNKAFMMSLVKDPKNSAVLLATLDQTWSTAAIIFPDTSSGAP